MLSLHASLPLDGLNGSRFFTAMPGSFGLLDDNHPHHVSLDRLTSSHPCVSVFDVQRLGLLSPGAAARLETPHGGYQLAHPHRAAEAAHVDSAPPGSA